MDRMKASYKELRKKLKNNFTRVKVEYKIINGIGEWLIQSDIKPTNEHIDIICNIFGSVPYPYQQEDRKDIIAFLHKNKFKDYKKWKKQLIK